MTTPDPIVQFIRDRLNEDEQLADEHHLGQCTIWTYGWRLNPGPCNCYGPARVLRGVQAKRSIIVNWEGEIGSRNSDYRAGLYRSLRLLASEWSTHGDYQEEWTP